MKISFKKQSDEHIESLERCLRTNEQYMETMVAGTDEYKKLNDVVESQRKELYDLKKPKVGLKEVLEILTIVGTFTTAGVNLYTSLHKDKTKVELVDKVIYNEEYLNTLANGTAKQVALKD